MTAASTHDDPGGAKAHVRRYGPTSLSLYHDSQGRPRVGRGSRLDRPDARARIAAVGADLEDVLIASGELTDEQVEALFEVDFADTVAAARAVVPRFDSMRSSDRRTAVSVLFDLGPETVEAVRAAADAAGDAGPDLVVDAATATRWYDRPLPPG